MRYLTDEEIQELNPSKNFVVTYRDMDMSDHFMPIFNDCILSYETFELMGGSAVYHNYLKLVGGKLQVRRIIDGKLCIDIVELSNLIDLGLCQWLHNTPIKDLNEINKLVKHK